MVPFSPSQWSFGSIFALTIWVLSILTVLRVKSGCQSVSQSRENRNASWAVFLAERRPVWFSQPSSPVPLLIELGTVRDLVSRRSQPDTLGDLVVLWERVECFVPAVTIDF